jgi:hypothetical protein
MLADTLMLEHGLVLGLAAAALIGSCLSMVRRAQRTDMGHNVENAPRAGRRKSAPAPPAAEVLTAELGPQPDRVTIDRCKSATSGPGPAGNHEYPPELPERHRHVYELADSGCSPMAIASRLGLPLGEVELILDMRQLQPW